MRAQVVIMFALGGIFKVDRLDGPEWAASVLIGVGQLGVCWASKVVWKAASKLFA